jgi:ABC-2 type transport system permease protein
MIVKEFRQMRRDKRAMGLMIGLPVMLLVIFGYAARFDVGRIQTVVVGPNAVEVSLSLDAAYDVVEVDATGDRRDVERLLRNSEVEVGIVTGGGPSTMLVDGSELFVAQSALRRIPAATIPEILFNPDLDTAPVMVPALIGLILLFIGTVVTSLGVVREREQGTLEQLAVMPLRPVDVIVGKIAPYFLVAIFDMMVVTIAGLLLFNVPFVGSWLVFGLFGLVFLFVVLGLGVAISTVSKSQGEAVQLAIMTLLPQIMLSGMIFPLESMAAGVRWIGYLLPLTWFIRGARGEFLKGPDFSAVAMPLALLTLMAAVVFGVAMYRFRKDLAPKRSDAVQEASPSAAAAS